MHNNHNKHDKHHKNQKHERQETQSFRGENPKVKNPTTSSEIERAMAQPKYNQNTLEIVS